MIHIDRTTEYAKFVVDGKKICGRAEYLACKRHLDDMARKDFDYIFDSKEAERHINIANVLTIGEGTEAVPLKTRGFQNFIIGSLFGWRKKRSKERRFREGYIQVARQNGKSFIAGEMAYDITTYGGYKYGRVFLTATKQMQANIVFDEIKKFISSDVELAELYKIRNYKHQIQSLITDSVIQAIGKSTKTIDGHRSNLAVIDEFHAHPTSQMYKLMQDGQIGVENALTLAITTAGFDLNAPCYEHYLFCKKILSGAIQKETLFVYIAELDAEDDIWDSTNWVKANPLQLLNPDESVNKEMIARMAEKAIDAKEKGGAELVNFLTKSLNRWVTTGTSAFIDAEKWRECGSDLTLEHMRGQDCYLGIDLSSGGDLTSIALVFPLERYGECYIWTHSYMPENRLLEHEKTDDAPYRAWTMAGLLTPTTGMYGIKTDYKAIIVELKNLITEYDLNVVGCGYDSHNISGILSDLEEILPCDLTEIVQSARSLSDSTIDFQLSVKAGLIKYDRKNALLNWSMVNAMTTQNSFGEIKIDKTTQASRIDPCDAIIDAYKLWFLERGENVNGEAMVDAWLDSLA